MRFLSLVQSISRHSILTHLHSSLLLMPTFRYRSVRWIPSIGFHCLRLSPIYPGKSCSGSSITNQCRTSFVPLPIDCSSAINMVRYTCDPYCGWTTATLLFSRVSSDLWTKSSEQSTRQAEFSAWYQIIPWASRWSDDHWYLQCASMLDHRLETE